MAKRADGHMLYTYVTTGDITRIVREVSELNKCLFSPQAWLDLSLAPPRHCLDDYQAKPKGKVVHLKSSTQLSYARLVIWAKNPLVMLTVCLKLAIHILKHRFDNFLFYKWGVTVF